MPNKSDIKKALDQIFIDTATRGRLDAVVGNIGLSRPTLGGDDGKFRAVAKHIALDYKQITKAFHEVLSIYLGPQYDVGTFLTQSAEIGDIFIYVNDASTFPQVGKITLDKGTASEEELVYDFIDYKLNKISLKSALKKNHSVIFTSTKAVNVKTTALAGVSSLVLEDSSFLPTSNYPYGIIVDLGNENQEYVLVSNNNTTTNTLTLSSPTTKNHLAFLVSPLRTYLEKPILIKKDFIEVNNSRNFPKEGYVRLGYGKDKTTDITRWDKQLGTLSFTADILSYNILGGDWTTQVFDRFSGTSSVSFGFDSAIDSNYIELSNTGSSGIAITREISFDLDENAPTVIKLEFDAYLDGDFTTSYVTMGFMDHQDETDPPFDKPGSYSQAAVRVLKNNGVSEKWFLNWKADGLFGGGSGGTNNEGTPDTYPTAGVYQNFKVEHYSPATSQAILAGGNGTTQWLSILKVDNVEIGSLLLGVVDTRTLKWLRFCLETMTNPATPAKLRIGPVTLTKTPEISSSYTASLATKVETIKYINNSVSNNILFLDNYTSQVFNSNESVEYGVNKSAVTPAQVFSKGTDWFLIDTEKNVLKIYIPDEILECDLFNCSFIHDQVTSGATTTVVDITNLPTIELNSVSFLTDSGLVQINGEILFYTNRDTTTNEITLAKNPITINNGDTVSKYDITYASSNLKEGNIREPNGDMQDNRFTGPYIYDFSSRGPGEFTTLNQNIPNPLKLLNDASSASYCLEVSDTKQWAVSTNILIGKGFSSSEDNFIVDITPKTTSSTLSNNASVGATSIILASSTSFPEAPLAGYRVVIDKGTVNEEIVTILTNNVGVNTLLLISPVTISHSIGATVQLINDVITLDTALQYNHSGSTNSGDNLVELVYPYISTLNVTSFLGNPSNKGYLILNYGLNFHKAESKIVTFPTSSTCQLINTSGFPTTGYPYPVILSKGKYVEEVAFVTNNNTTTNVLTFSTTPNNIHSNNSLVYFEEPKEEFIKYDDVTLNTLEFSNQIVLNSYHRTGETIAFSPAISQSLKNGWSFPLKLPSDFTLILEYFFDLIRAAGVKVLITNKK